jgi:hypothetical protein
METEAASASTTEVGASSIERDHNRRTRAKQAKTVRKLREIILSMAAESHYDELADLHAEITNYFTIACRRARVANLADTHGTRVFQVRRCVAQIIPDISAQVAADIAEIKTCKSASAGASNPLLSYKFMWSDQDDPAHRERALKPQTFIFAGFRGARIGIILIVRGASRESLVESIRSKQAFFGEEWRTAHPGMPDYDSISLSFGDIIVAATQLAYDLYAGDSQGWHRDISGIDALALLHPQKARKCSVCSQSGHSKRNCPTLHMK